MSRTWIWLGVGSLLTLGLIRVGLDYAGRQDDRALIRTAVQDAIDASRDGRPGSALDLLSKNLTMNHQDMPVDRKAVADFIRDQKPTVEVTEINPKIIGEEGRMISPVNLSLGILGERTIPAVTMIFAKEDDRMYGIIPVKKWKMTEIRVPDESWESVMGQ